MKYKIVFECSMEVESEDEAHENLIDYLHECVRNEDVTAFEFEQVEE